MQEMATNLIASLRSSTLKLAAAMRTISWLRRVAPELGGTNSTTGTAGAGSLGSLFLVCRLANLEATLGALEPLRALADQETLRLEAGAKGEPGGKSKWDGGQQTERYLKRYIEIFREQSFAIISMYRSIFPPAAAGEKDDEGGDLQQLPTALATFPMKLVAMLETTLRTYLPNVRDKSSRDSLLTQVLYCAGSLGRLGGDFSLILAFLNENEAREGEEEKKKEKEEEEDSEMENEEWVEVIRKHRVLAGRLELMVGSRDT
jgi:hypothetical protein